MEFLFISRLCQNKSTLFLRWRDYESRYSNNIKCLFSICITAFIYQNNAQQDRIDTLEGYAQLDTDSTWDEIDKLKEDLSDLESRYSYTTESLNKWQVVLDNELSERLTNTENLKITEGNVLVLFDERDKLLEQSNMHTKYINDLTRRVDGLVDLLKNWN